MSETSAAEMLRYYLAQNTADLELSHAELAARSGVSKFSIDGYFRRSTDLSADDLHHIMTAISAKGTARFSHAKAVADFCLACSKELQKTLSTALRAAWEG